MIFNFNEKITKFLKIIAKNAQESNLRVFFVGGIVRDAILNQPIKDIDLILEGNAIEFAKKLPDEIAIKSIHKNFATVKLSYEDSEIDIASTRIEKYPYSGCLPVVTKIGVDIKEDVKRRDFTLNSLYCEIKIKDDTLQYELIDLTAGINDLKNKKLVSLHNKTYIDDPTRIIRGIDFINRFGFDFSKSDEKLIENFIQNFNSEDFEFASIDRINSVLLKVFSKEYYLKTLLKLIEIKFYKIFSINELKIDIEKIKSIIRKLDLNSEQISKFLLNILQDKEIKVNENEFLKIYKSLLRMQIENQAYFLYKNFKYFAEFLTAKNIKIKINGDDLLKIGFKGKKIGEILDKLFVEKMKKNSKILSKYDELTWVKSNFICQENVT